MDRASLQHLLNQGLSLAEIGRRFARHESTVAYWVEKHGLEAANRDRSMARGGLSRAELERLVQAGCSVAEIAVKLDRGKATVRHWLKKYDLKTDRAAGKMRSSASRAAHDAGIARPDMVCARHGQTVFALDGRGYYRCVQCRSGAVVKRRRKLKAILVHDAGGACRLCGYRRCVAALEFHHLVPAEKEFSLSQEGMTRSLAKARVEAAKCVLLCANCHAEVEAGFATLSEGDTYNEPHAIPIMVRGSTIRGSSMAE